MNMGKNIILLGIFILFLLCLFWAFFPSLSPSWTGFGPKDPAINFEGKTLWDWLELLIIPFFLGVGIWWLEMQDKQKKLNQEIERQNHEKLDNYFNFMKGLLLEKDLRNKSANDEVRTIARSKTLSVLRSIDGPRKGELLQFLFEAGLINNPPIISLTGADLSNVKLDGATLLKVNILGANFTNASLKGAYIKDSIFRGCIFNRADFQNCHIDHTDFEMAELNNIDFSSVDLSSVIFKYVTLEESIVLEDQIPRDQIESIGSLRNIEIKKRVR